MSARDAESGSSSYKGGSGSAGGVGNGGVGGGRGGGGWGGGAGYNGGAQSRTGMTTGAEWKGNTAFGRPGSMATGYAMRDPRSLAAAGMGPTLGSFGQFRTMQGNPMFPGLRNPMQSASGFNAQQAAGKLAALQAAQPRVPGLLDNPSPAAPAAPAAPTTAAPQYPAFNAEMALPEYPKVTQIDIPYGEPVADFTTPFGPRTAWGNAGFRTVKAQTIMNDPDYGFPSGGYASGLGKAGTGQSYGVDGRNRYR